MAQEEIHISTLIMVEIIGDMFNRAPASFREDNSRNQEEEESIRPMSQFREDHCTTLVMVQVETSILCNKHII